MTENRTPKTEVINFKNSVSPKQGKKREWLNRLVPLGRSAPSQTAVISDVSTPEMLTLRGPDVSPSRKGYFKGLGVRSSTLPSGQTDDIGTQSGNETYLSLPIPTVVLTSNDFLDFVLAHPGNRVEKITVRTVIERTHSSSDIPRDKKSLESDAATDYSPSQRRISGFEEFQLVHCPSAPMALHMPPIIIIPGGGIFYFWKAGFTLYLSKHFDLSRCIFMGTSAGALTSIVTLVGHSISQASRLAITMAMQRQVWEKPHFLAGVLHNLAGDWLEQVIPKDIDVSILKHRLLVIAYRVSRVRLEGLCHFRSRKDLIECLLASIHIPFYANGRAAVKARGMNYLDGSFGPDIIKTFAQCIPPEKIILIRCSETDYEQPIPRRECIRKLPPQQMLDLVHTGFLYAEKLHKESRLLPLVPYERHPPGTFSSKDDPYLDAKSLTDDIEGLQV